jgi:hypothetical protein
MTNVTALPRTTPAYRTPDLTCPPESVDSDCHSKPPHKLSLVRRLLGLRRRRRCRCLAVCTIHAERVTE